MKENKVYYCELNKKYYNYRKTGEDGKCCAACYCSGKFATIISTDAVFCQRLNIGTVEFDYLCDKF